MKKVRYYFFIILGLILISDFIVLQFYLTSFNAGLIVPGFLGVLFLVYGYYKIKTGVNIFYRFGKIRKILNIFIILFLVSFIIIEFIIISYTYNYSGESPKYVVILGAGLKNNQLSLTLKRRVDKAIIYLKINQNSVAIVSGGRGFDEKITESSAMKSYMIKNGIDEKRIIEENKSKSTVENLKFSKEVLIKTGWDMKEDILIVTNEFHMMRARLIADRQGINTVPLPASTPYSVIINNFIREYFAVVKTYIFDR